MAEPEEVTFVDLAKRVGLCPVTCHKCGANTWTEEVLAALLKAATEVLAAGGSVRLREFGVLRSYHMKASAMNTPIAGAPKKRRAYTYVRFHATPSLRNALNVADQAKQKKGSRRAHS